MSRKFLDLLKTQSDALSTFDGAESLDSIVLVGAVTGFGAIRREEEYCAFVVADRVGCQANLGCQLRDREVISARVNVGVRSNVNPAPTFVVPAASHFPDRRTTLLVRTRGGPPHTPGRWGYCCFEAPISRALTGLNATTEDAMSTVRAAKAATRDTNDQIRPTPTLAPRLPKD
jgi:hypothetical protein